MKKQININDIGFHNMGAIWSHTPIKSDKVFKKRPATTVKDEAGTWLCSWLSGGPQTKTPIWVDRYYNPNKYTATEALKVQKQYNEYKSKFDYVLEAVGAEDDYVFDKKSDLAFEPGCLYAYYRIGPKENKVTINANKNSLLHEGIEPTYFSDRSTYINTSPELFLDGTKYIETKNLSHIKNRFPNACIVSAKTSFGVSDLLRAVQALLGPSPSFGSLVPVITGRQNTVLKNITLHVQSSIDLLSVNGCAHFDLIAFELHCALKQVDLILGKTATDDILENVFSSFCVGK